MENWKEIILNNSGPLKRPVAMASFIMNALINGGDLWWWKFTNLVIHILCGICVFRLTALLLTADNGKTGRDNWLPAAIVAGIWLLHPLHVSTVLYTVQRMTQLSALFVLLGMIAYVSGRMRQIAGKPGNTLLVTAFALFTPLGIFSKENAVLMPLYMLLAEIFLFRFKSTTNAFISTRTLKLILILPIMAGMAVLLVFFNELVLDRYVIRDFTLQERLLTEFRILVNYLFLIIIPLQENMGLLHDDIDISKHLLNPATTLASLTELLLLIILAWRMRTRLALFSFGIFFFFSAHLIESTIFPLELMFEHRNYLASYGILVALFVLLRKVIQNEKVKSFIVASIFATFCFSTFIHADTWSAVDSLYNYVYKVHPKSRRIIAFKAGELANDGQYDEARQLISELNGLGVFFQNLNISCQEKGFIDAAQFTNDQITGAKFLDMYAINEMQTLSLKGLHDKCEFSSGAFLSLLDKVLSYPAVDKFEGHKLFVYKAHYFWREGRKAEAYASLEYATSMVPGDPIPLYLASEWSVQSADTVGAEEYYLRAVQISDMSNELHSKLATNVGRLIKDMLN